MVSMSILHTIRTLHEMAQQWPAMRARGAAAAPEWLTNASGADSGLPDLAAQRNQARVYTWSTWVAAAINVVSLSCKPSVLHVMALQGEKRRAIDSHPFELLSRNPNPLDTGSLFQDRLFEWRLLTGNAYVWLNRARARDPITEMWILPTHEVQPHPDGRLSIDGYAYKPTGTGESIFIPKWQIMHWRGGNPMTPFEGMSMVEVLSSAVKTDYAQSRWNEKNFGQEQGKVPGVLAFPDPIPDGIWERMKHEFYDTDKSGPRRHVLLMRNTGNGTPKWVSTYMSPAEMEFMDSRRWNMEEIYTALAPGLYTMLSESSTEANSRVGAELFKSYCYGLLVDLAQRFTKDVLPAYGNDLVAEYDDVREANRELELAEMAEYAKTHTIDEVRERYYEDKAIGDERGQMLPAQIHHTTILPEITSVEKPPVPAQLQPFVEGQQPPPTEPQEDAAPEPAPEDDEQSEDASATRAVVDLRKWRAAVKKRGKPYGFKSDHIPRRLVAHITNALHLADSTAEMLSIFDDVLGTKATARFLPLGADDPRLPVPDGDVVISDRDVEAALRSWDAAFPELAGLLDATVIGQDQFDNA